MEKSLEINTKIALFKGKKIRKSQTNKKASSFKVKKKYYQ